MSKVFLKTVKLINGGYLSDEKNNPVYNEKFISAQKRAEYVVTFANLAKNKDFNGKKADSIEDLKNEVIKSLSKKDIQYLSAPKEIKRTLNNQLTEEAFAWMKFQEDSTKVEKVNNFLQEFNVIKEFEEFGLFFEEDIVKLNKVYTIEEIVEAVNSVIDILN